MKLPCLRCFGTEKKTGKEDHHAVQRQNQAVHGSLHTPSSKPVPSAVQYNPAASSVSTDVVTPAVPDAPPHSKLDKAHAEWQQRQQQAMAAKHLDHKQLIAQQGVSASGADQGSITPPVMSPAATGPAGQAYAGAADEQQTLSSVTPLQRQQQLRRRDQAESIPAAVPMASDNYDSFKTCNSDVPDSSIPAGTATASEGHTNMHPAGNTAIAPPANRRPRFNPTERPTAERPLQHSVQPSATALRQQVAPVLRPIPAAAPPPAAGGTTPAHGPEGPVSPCAAQGIRPPFLTAGQQHQQPGQQPWLAQQPLNAASVTAAPGQWTEGPIPRSVTPTPVEGSEQGRQAPLGSDVEPIYDRAGADGHFGTDSAYDPAAEGGPVPQNGADKLPALYPPIDHTAEPRRPIAASIVTDSSSAGRVADQTSDYKAVDDTADQLPAVVAITGAIRPARQPAEISPADVGGSKPLKPAGWPAEISPVEIPPAEVGESSPAQHEAVRTAEAAAAARLADRRHAQGAAASSQPPGAASVQQRADDQHAKLATGGVAVATTTSQAAPMSERQAESVGERARLVGNGYVGQPVEEIAMERVLEGGPVQQQDVSAARSDAANARLPITAAGVGRDDSPTQGQGDSFGRPNAAGVGLAAAAAASERPAQALAGACITAVAAKEHKHLDASEEQQQQQQKQQLPLSERVRHAPKNAAANIEYWGANAVYWAASLGLLALEQGPEIISKAPAAVKAACKPALDKLGAATPPSSSSPTMASTSSSSTSNVSSREPVTTDSGVASNQVPTETAHVDTNIDARVPSSTAAAAPEATVALATGAAASGLTASTAAVPSAASSYAVDSNQACGTPAGSAHLLQSPARNAGPQSRSPVRDTAQSFQPMPEAAPVAVNGASSGISSNSSSLVSCPMSNTSAEAVVQPSGDSRSLSDSPVGAVVQHEALISDGFKGNYGNSRTVNSPASWAVLDQPALQPAVTPVEQRCDATSSGQHRYHRETDLAPEDVYTDAMRPSALPATAAMPAGVVGSAAKGPVAAGTFDKPFNGTNKAPVGPVSRDATVAGNLGDLIESDIMCMKDTHSKPRSTVQRQYVYASSPTDAMSQAMRQLQTTSPSSPMRPGNAGSRGSLDSPGKRAYPGWQQQQQLGSPPVAAGGRHRLADVMATVQDQQQV